MKKLLFAALLICLCAALALPTVAVAESNDDYKTSEAYAFLKDFVENNPKRYGTKSEEAAATYLKAKFDVVLQENCRVTSEVVPFGTTEENASYNVVATVEAPFEKTDKQILICAHFDSMGEGANDNASGVTALYLAMKNIAQNYDKLKVNVVFVAFGGEERGLLGSLAYLESMSPAEKENTLVMFNFDSIANGDNLYLFCENKSTDLANLILDNSKQSSSIIEKPYAVGVYPIDVYGYGYYEKIQGSDHTPFRLANIPTAIFFSGNFSQWDYVESTNSEKLTMNTSSDTLENLDKYNGAQTVQRIEIVADTVCSTVLSEGFLSVAENARSQLMNNSVLFNYWWPRLAVGAVLILLAVFAWLYYRKLEKQSILGTATIKTDKIFASPDADNIFSFNEEKKDENKTADIDDIFTFKK